MGSHGFSVGSHGFSWVLMGSHGFSGGSLWVLRLCIFGFSGGPQAGTPPSGWALGFAASRSSTAARRPHPSGGGQGAAEDGQRVQQLQR